MEILDILRLAIENACSDVFLVPGAPISMKINGALQHVGGQPLTPADTGRLAEQVYQLQGSRSIQRLQQAGDDDFSVSVPSVGRFRCNAFKQRNSLAMVLRVMSFTLPNPRDFHIPDAVMELARIRKGIVLVTGPAGSGKSTTLACLIDRINSELKGHIITLEDPIEFIHPHKNCIVSQREIEHDTESYPTALRAALRQAPNVIFLGEMRDFETIRTALTAGETGQLLLSTLHTVGAAKTIDRIIDVSPAEQQQQVRVQLSMVLKAIVSQQLIPTVDGGIEAAFEVMVVNSAIQNMIRESKVHQMDNAIFAGAAQGMRTMDSDILRLFSAGRISREAALLYASNPDLLAKKL